MGLPSYSDGSAVGQVIIVSRSQAAPSPFRHGSTFTLQCAPGFSSGDPLVTQAKVTCYMGAYTGLALNCFRKYQQYILRPRTPAQAGRRIRLPMPTHAEFPC
jgi:hypothetical protein